MNKHILGPAVLVLSVSVLSAAAAAAGGSSSVVAGARYHVASSVLPDLPYDDGDVSALVGLEYADEAAFWQLGVGYAWDAGTPGDPVDKVITPQLNLLFLENSFMAGIGLLKSYVETAADSEWSDIYFQLLTGLRFQLSRAVALEVLAVYPFEDWGKLGDFDTGDLEGVAALSLRW